MPDYKRGGLIMQASELSGISRRTFYRVDPNIETLRELIADLRASPHVRPKELADQLQVSYSTVYRWLSEGRLKYKQIRNIILIPLNQQIEVNDGN